MYVQVAIPLTATQNVVTAYEALRPVNVSDNTGRVFNQIGDNTAMRGFFVKQQNNVQAFATLDRTFGVFPANGYDGWALLSGASTSILTGYSLCAEFRLTMSQLPTYGMTLLFDVSGGGYPLKVGITKYASGTIYFSPTLEIENTARSASVFISAQQLQSAFSGFTAGDRLDFCVVWSDATANTVVKILNIDFGITLFSEGTDILSVESSENFMDAQLSIASGICEQYTNIDLYDRSGILHEMAHRGQLTTDRDIFIYAIHAGVKYLIGQYFTSDFDCNSNSSVVTVRGADGFRYLQNLNFQSVAVQTYTVHQLLSMVFAQSKYPWVYLDNATAAYCEQIYTPNCWIPDTDILTLLEDICRIGLLRVYWTNGYFVVGRTCPW